VVTLTRLDSTQPDFQARLTRLLQFDDAADAAIEQTVAAILHDVKTRGDAAVLEYTARFDGLSVKSLGELEIPQAELQAALTRLPAARRDALEAAARVREYHEHQRAGVLGLHRCRRHRAWPEGDAARPRRGSMCRAARPPIRRRC
jgi:histidinol dehydrogenase